MDQIIEGNPMQVQESVFAVLTMGMIPSYRTNPDCPSTRIMSACHCVGKHIGFRRSCGLVWWNTQLQAVFRDSRGHLVFELICAHLLQAACFPDAQRETTLTSALPTKANSAGPPPHRPQGHPNAIGQSGKDCLQAARRWLSRE